ncbi:MAG TPA: polysaccharide biosynthesis/export family protein [Longimicrobium sp.]
MKPSRLVRLLLLSLVPLAAFAGGAAAQQQATLRPGDAIRVEIWREEDLTGEFGVALDGTVTLPLLGRQRLVDIPLDRLRDTLTTQYRVHLRNPSINITPIRRVTVLGEVQRPGLYGADPTLALAGLVALAGGATPDGSLDRIRIVRDGQVLRERVGAGETLTTADVRSGDQIIVDQKSWFARNTTFVVSTILTLGGIITSIILASGGGGA